MPFNSIGFLLFFVLVFAAHALARGPWRNRILVAASYLFYAGLDWRFTLLVLVITVVTYACALGMRRCGTDAGRSLLLGAALAVNLGTLGFFKYFNFFAQSVAALMKAAGAPASVPLLVIVLPVGVSFFTFRAISYCVDVFRRQQDPTDNFLSFALYIAFFPQLVAGPIERASRFLPQIESRRFVTADKIAEGTFLVLYGLFLKVVVADNLALIVDAGAFDGCAPANGLQALLSVYAFAFQVFADFSGYSNIARGLSSFLGFEATVNFRSPYFATNPRDFWQRWHISLSSWLRDYVYIPLGGNRKGLASTLRNLTLTMLLGGLWHGAAWTFVIWGGLHGLLLSCHRLSSGALPSFPTLRKPAIAKGWTFLKWLVFFNLVCVGWVFFRASSLGNALSVLKAVWAAPAFALDPAVIGLLRVIAPFMPVFVFMDILEHRRGTPLAVFGLPLALRVPVYLVLVYEILVFGVNDAQSFIYAQF